MNLQIVGQHVQVTEALQRIVREKLQRLQRHFSQAMDAHVIMKVESSNSHSVEANIMLHGQRLFALAREHDMYAAIDKLIDKLDKQLCKLKSKLNDHHSLEGAHDVVHATALV